jgi:hypothetical protein
VAFTRDTVDGSLSYRDVITKNLFPLIDGARGVAINPNGKAAYVTGYNDQAVVAIVFDQPLPVLDGVSPGSAVAGSAAISVTVSGKDFVPGSEVRIGGSARSTVFMNETKLVATLLASDLSVLGNKSVTVFTPTPGGGTSNAGTFSIIAAGSTPVPSVESVSLQGVVAGTSSAAIAVKGTGFIPASQVKFNASGRATTYVSSTLLNATLLAADLDAIGTGVISVDNNPAPLLMRPEAVSAATGSNGLTIQIVSPNLNPPPALNALSPAHAAALGSQAQIEVTLTGAAFTSLSQGWWNGEARPTQFVNAATLKMTISAGDLIVPGVASVQVNTPNEGGGTSNLQTFVIDTPLTFLFLPLLWR